MTSLTNPQSKIRFETMTLAYHERVAVLTLSRPNAMNAMNARFFDDFQEALADISSDNRHMGALLITAEGSGFCAGADLKDQSGEMPPHLGDKLRQSYNPLIKNLKELPIPTVVAINGAAAGAGMSLVCACDIAIASKQAYFLQAFINIALIPDAGSTYFLPRLVGRSRAAALMMLGEKLPAEKALEFGLISQVVDHDELLKTGLQLAEKLSTMPTEALFSIRKLLDQSEINTLDQQLEAEATAQQIAGQSPDFMEGVMAFIQKRKPKFNLT